MKATLKNAVCKSAMLVIAGLICQPVVAGVSVYLNVINNTQAEFSATTCPPSVSCGDEGTTVSVAKGQTATNITSVELAWSHYYTPATAIFPIYLNGSSSELCTITFTGQTYAVGVPPRMDKEAVAISNMPNKDELMCSLSESVLKSKTSDSSGDTEHIFIVVNPKPGGVMAPLNPALAPLSPGIAQLNPSIASLSPPLASLAKTYVKSDKTTVDEYHEVIYTVTCKDGTVSSFGPNSAGTCYDYTNRQVTYSTNPTTCYPEFRVPTLAEFRQLVGEPFCRSSRTANLLPPLCRAP